MKQIDMFEETLAKKIQRLDQWIHRLQKEMWFLKSVFHLKENQKKIKNAIDSDQRDMFVG